MRIQFRDLEDLEIQIDNPGLVVKVNSTIYDAQLKQIHLDIEEIEDKK